MGNFLQAIAEKQERIASTKVEMQSHLEQVKTLEEQIKTILESREQWTVRRRELLKLRDEGSEQINRLDKEAYRLEAQREKYSEQMQGYIDYLWNEYELTPVAAREYRHPDYQEIAQVRKVSQQLKQSIKELGHVNVNAIEEYKEVSERYTFLKGQHDDLIHAEENLKKIIEELENGMREQFMTQFAEIKKEFNKVFKELFGGGTGTLELMDGDDILTCGINIIAQPPGKKLQNMMQLSGGEKALTAICLLFAILNLKPSPFCLLDEIEAALDDANVVRYADYLNKLKEDTQFIVITHRRGTMVAADRLYGITMQEKGISTLVAVDLIEEGVLK
jgi:chromosome segregation protein